MNNLLNSESVNRVTNGIFDTFVYCCYIGAVVYGFVQLFTDVLLLGITTTLIIITLVSLLVNYFKVPRAPVENSAAVFGKDPIRPTNFNSGAGSHGGNDHISSDDDDLDPGLDDYNNDANNESTGSSSFHVPNGVLTNSVGLLRNHRNGGVKHPIDEHAPSRLLPSEGSYQYTTPITIVGHRGCGLDVPENTLTAFRQCKSRGCTFVEFDVSLTKDNVPVIFHDDDLLRVAGLDKQISDMTWEELKGVDLSVNHPLREKYVGERIPSFEEALQLLIDLDMKFFIDLKDTNERIVNTICEAFTRHPQLYKLAVVSSFYVRVIYEIRRRDPNIIGCMAWRPHFHQYKGWNVDGSVLERRYNFFLQDWLACAWDICHNWLVLNFFWWFLGLSSLLLQKDAISKHELINWSKKGVRVFLWTVNSPLEKVFFSQTVRVSYLTDTLDGDVLKSVKSK